MLHQQQFNDGLIFTKVFGEYHREWLSKVPITRTRSEGIYNKDKARIPIFRSAGFIHIAV